jgi:hypothetical protein
MWFPPATDPFSEALRKPQPHFIPSPPHKPNRSQNSPGCFRHTRDTGLLRRTAPRRRWPLPQGWRGPWRDPLHGEYRARASSADGRIGIVRAHSSRLDSGSSSRCLGSRGSNGAGPSGRCRVRGGVRSWKKVAPRPSLAKGIRHQREDRESRFSSRFREANRFNALIHLRASLNLLEGSFGSLPQHSTTPPLPTGKIQNIR